MIAQYTQAGIVAELKRLAVPASVDSIPSSAMQEDHVSMGWHAARKLRRAVDGLRRVLAIEMLTAARALDLRAPLSPSPVTGAVRDVIRTKVAGPGPDRHVAAEIDAVVDLLASGAITAAANDRLPPNDLPSSQEPSATTPTTVDRQGEPMTTATSQPAGPRPVRAATGTSLTAKSWATEAPLRMLCNNLDPDVAEDPDNLVVYGGTGKAARDWRELRRHLPVAHRPGAGRDAAGPVRPAGRGAAHP